MNRTALKRSVLALALAAVIHHSARANEALLEDSLWELSPEELGQVRLTSIATGSVTPLDKSAAITTVITEDDIQAMGATDLDEVLETVPGLHVSRSTQTLSPKYIFRGITSTYNPQALLLINGIPQTTLAFGNRGNVWGGMPIKAIQQIEVIRGPGSALYGADAYAGVINITTKSRKDIPGTEVGSRLGSFSSRSAWVLHGGEYKDTDIAFTLEYSETNGHKEIIPADAQTVYDDLFGTNVSRAPGSINAGKKMLDSRLDVDAGNLHVRAGYQGRFDLETGTGVAQALDPNGQYRSDRVNTDLTYTFADLPQDWSLVSQASYYYGTQDPSRDNQLYPPGAFGGAFPDGLIGNPGYREENARLQLTAQYSGFEKHRVRTGTGAFWGDIYRTTETKNFYPDGTPRPGVEDVSDTDEVWLSENDRTSFYGFIQDEWQFAPDWQLTSGIRYDHYSDFGDTLNPRLALVWAMTNTMTTKFLYGRAFRAPSMIELYVTSNPVSLGNENLKPETIDTYELAFSHHLTSAIHYSANVYFYKIEDYIDFVPIGAGANQASNVGKREGHGLELEAAYSVSPSWRILGNYAYQRSEDERTGARVGESPSHEVYIRSEHELSAHWNFYAQMLWVGSQERVLEDERDALDDYATLDLTLRNRNWIKNLNLAVSVRNLLDSEVKEPSPGPNAVLPQDIPMPGRSLYAELGYTF